MRNEPVDGYRLPAQFTRYPNTWIRDFAEDSILVRCTKRFCKANASGFIRFRIFWYAGFASYPSSKIQRNSDMLIRFSF